MKAWWTTSSCPKAASSSRSPGTPSSSTRSEEHTSELQSRSDLVCRLLLEKKNKERLAILLGGRTAEEICFGQISTGAQNDLERATEISRAMVVEYGMNPKVGPLSFGHIRRPPPTPWLPAPRPRCASRVPPASSPSPARFPASRLIGRLGPRRPAPRPTRRGRAVHCTFFFFKGTGAPRDLPSSPPRRSPD